MRKSLLLLITVVSVACSADLWWNTKKGTKLYKKGKYDKAQQQFDLASAATPASQEAQFNRALNMARTGKVGEAKQILAGLKFDNPAKAAELAYTTARVNEIEGDLAVQKKDFGAARTAYTEALRQNVKALKANPLHKGALKNAEIAGRKLASLPEDKNQDKNKQNQQNQQNKDQQNKDQQDQNKNDQDKNDPKQDQNKNDQNKNDQNKNDQDKNDPKKDQNKDNKDQPKPDQPKEDPAQANAEQLLDKYGDDAKDLSKPPVKKGKRPAGGKDW